MAKGETAFDAAAVLTALQGLQANEAKLDIDALFPAGSDKGDTTASPKIWEDMAGFKAANDKYKADARRGGRRTRAGSSRRSARSSGPSAAIAAAATSLPHRSELSRPDGAFSGSSPSPRSPSAVVGAAAFWLLTMPQRLDADEIAALGTGDAKRGERIFHAGGCTSCHARPKSKGDGTAASWPAASS